MNQFRDKVIWITGASSGIGEAMAKEWIRLGAQVILTARRGDRLQKLAEQLNLGRSAPAAKVLEADLLQLDQISELTQRAIDCFGKIDILFNNAGASQRGYAIDMPFEIDHRLISLDLLSPIVLTKAILPHLAARRAGRIIVTGSLMGELELPGNATYACVKHGINGYFLALAYELEPLGISVQVLMPGFVKTEISIQAYTPSGRNGIMEKTHEKAMTSDEFAARACRQIARNKPVIVIAGPERVALWLRRFTPSLYRWLVKKFAKRMLKERTDGMRAQ